MLDSSGLDLFPDSARIEQGELELGGLGASELAERFGTPLVVYCEDSLRKQARALRTAAGEDGRVFYGTKAFPNVALLRLFREEGVGADVAAAGELAFARAAGLSGDELVVHGNNKDEALLADAAVEGAAVVLDAPDEPALASAAGVARALVRVTLGVDADTHEAIVTGHHGSKFGLPPEQALAVVADTLARDIDVLGLHVHVGSQLADFTAQAETIQRLASFAAACRESLGWEAQVANLGGGFGIRHHPEDEVPDAAELAAAAAATARTAFAEAGLPEPAVWLEPGRCLVGRAGGHPLPRRLGEAPGGSDLGRRRRRDVGQPASAALRRPLHGPERASRRRGARRARERRGDALRVGRRPHRRRLAPVRRKRGDLLAVPATGAYTLAMSSNYNGVTRPAAVLVRNGDARVIRRRESVDDLLALESV